MRLVLLLHPLLFGPLCRVEPGVRHSKNLMTHEFVFGDREKSSMDAVRYRHGGGTGGRQLPGFLSEG